MRQKQQQQASGLVNQGLANNYKTPNNNLVNNNLNLNSGSGSSSTDTSASSSSSYDASTGSSHLLVPPQQPHIPTAPPETLHGETNLQQFLNSLQTSPSSQSLSLAPNNKQTHVLLASHIQSHLHTPYHQQQQQQHHHNLHHLQLVAQSHHVATNNLTNNLPLQNSQKTISLSEFLRPPFNAPLFHPVKLPGRRPYPGPVKKVPASKPILPQQLPRHPPGFGGPVPQPSVIVNHYRKPVPSLLRPFIKDKPFPLQPLAASVLLLGQPTELSNQRKTDPHFHHHQHHMVKKPVPYADLMPQGSLSNVVFNKNSMDKFKTKPNLPIKTPQSLAPEKIKSQEMHTVETPQTTTKMPNPVSVFKEPFETQEVKEEPTQAELATMKPAVNEGFKPDTVVVESGFKPILRQDGPMPPPEVVEQMASRREDPGLEIDEAMETDTLFLTAVQQQTQTQNFEPMFIPSPPDSTNSTVIIRKSTGNLHQKPLPATAGGATKQSAILKDHPYNKPISSMLKSSLNLPETAQLRNASLEDIILNESNEEEDPENTEYKQNLQNHLEDSTKLKLIQIKETVTETENHKENEKIEQSEEYLDEEESQPSEKTKLSITTTSSSFSSSTTIKQATQTEKSPSSTTENLLKFTNKLKNYDISNLDDIELDDDEFNLENIALENIEINPEEDEEEDIFDLDTELEAQAAERIDTYYLPPDNRKVPHANIPSGSVITYDGKSIVDSSLVLPPKLDTETEDISSPRFYNGNNNFQSLSKSEQLRRTTPQLVPFRGEIPPLTPDLNPETIQRSVTTNYNTYSSSSSRPVSTKLQIIRNNNRNS